MAEQLILDQLDRQRSIDRHEALGAAGTAVMDCSGENLFAGPRLSNDKDREIGTRVWLNLINLRPDGLASANNLAEKSLPGQSIGDSFKFRSGLTHYTGAACNWPTLLEVASPAHALPPDKRAALSHALKNICTINPRFDVVCALKSRRRAVLGSLGTRTKPGELRCSLATG